MINLSIFLYVNIDSLISSSSTVVTLNAIIIGAATIVAKTQMPAIINFANFLDGRALEKLH